MVITPLLGALVLRERIGAAAWAAAIVSAAGLYLLSGTHGLHADGGPEGVGRAVNRAVVGCLIGIFFVNLVFTQWLLAVFPQVGVFR